MHRVCFSCFSSSEDLHACDVQMLQMLRMCWLVAAAALSLSLTFQLADLRLTVRPLLVTVHFILMKKSRSVLSSLPFLPKPLPETQTSTERGNEAGIIKLLLYYIVFYCDGAKWNNGIKLS